MNPTASFRTQFLHFDSANANYLTDLNNTTTITSNPYKAQYFMNQTFRNIKRVYLTSLELPVGFTNVRTGSTSTLKFTLNDSAYTVVLPEKNYTTIASLLTDLNTACVGIVSNVVITFSLTTSLTTPLRLLITFTGSTTTSSFSITDTNLSKYILGFRNGKDTLVSSVYTASNANYNLNCDNYILMYIPTLNGLNSSMSNQISTFKIPLNVITNQVYFYQESSSFKQWVDIHDKNLLLNNLTVVLYDKFGNNLNPNGMDYSFSITVEHYV